MAHYIFNVVSGDATSRSARESAVESLRAGLWGIGAGEPHCDALAAGDLALIYLGAPDRIFIGRAELTSIVHEWTPPQARAYPGDSPTGVLLTGVEEWEPPVPMRAVLARIDTSAGARADFEAGVVRITADEYDTAVAASTPRA